MAIWKQEIFGTGRCVNCGFLGKRDSISSVSMCYEATAVDRLSGIFTETRGETIVGGALQQRIRIPTRPWCFVRKRDFQQELTDIGAQDNQADKVQQLIKEDRLCPSWYPWREFMTPKEHIEEQMMLHLEQRREEFELKLEERNREERKRSNRVIIWLGVAAIIFAALEVYAALSAINPYHWLYNWLR